MIGQVMSHTAGLYTMNGLDFDLVIQKSIGVYNNVTEIATTFRDRPLDFLPGTQFNYSNYGYLLVGAVIESVLNQTYESAINQMFRELDMNSTVCERRELIIPNRARYYLLDENDPTKLVNDPIIPNELLSMEAMWSAGDIMSTVPDLLRFGSHMIKWSKGIQNSPKCNKKNLKIQFCSFLN